MTRKNAYPEYVSFNDAAKIVVREGLAGSMTSQGLRYIARSRENWQDEDERWPFGDKPGQKPYLRAGNTRLMATQALLDYLRKHPPIGRGPDTRPRAKASRS